MVDSPFQWITFLFNHCKYLCSVYGVHYCRFRGITVCTKKALPRGVHVLQGHDTVTCISIVLQSMVILVIPVHKKKTLSLYPSADNRNMNSGRSIRADRCVSVMTSY